MTLSSAELALRHHAALSIAYALGPVALAYQASPERMATSSKGAQDFLTVADGDVERRFREAITELFPHDVVLGEEQGGGDGPAMWIIDPIDGTANFARGSRHWGISIGFLMDGKPEIGVILAPAYGEMFSARRGHGATLNGAPIRAATTKSLTTASVELGWSAKIAYQGHLTTSGALFAAGASVMRSGSAALGLAHVANGRSDCFAERIINSWDVAAGVVLVEEAGGWVNDFFGGDWRTAPQPILACAPGVAGELRTVLGIS